LYHKKVNIESKNKRRFHNRNNDAEYQPQKNSKNIYIQKMIPKNEIFDFSNGGENIPNVRSSMEDIFSNEDNKRRAIKYVINIGKNRDLRNSPYYDGGRRFERSASPNRGRAFGNVPRRWESYENSPNRTRFQNRRGDSYFNNRLATLNDYTPIVTTGYNNLGKKNITYKNNVVPGRNNYNPYSNQMLDDEYYEYPQNYISVEESQNDGGEILSVNNDDRIPRLRNVDPRMERRVNKVLNDTYERAARRVRNKNNSAYPNIRQSSNSRYILSNDNTYDDDMNQLIRTVEDLQAIIDGQKNEIRLMRKDNFNKDNEIISLKNELDNMQKELDDRRLEHDKEIDDIYKNKDNDSKLKNEYFKLLQDYDNNINDYNILKDD